MKNSTLVSNPFNIGDIVDMHCGEQGIVVEILDNNWVNLLQCSGHVEKAYKSDIWLTDTEQNGKAALHEFFIKTFGYSGVDENEYEPQENADDIFFLNIEPDENVPF